MIRFNKYGLKQDIQCDIITEDLVCIANLEKQGNVDSKVVSVAGQNIIIEGKYKIDGKHAVVGTDLIKVLTSTIEDNTTKITYEKAYGVLGEHAVGNHFRTVIVVDDSKDIQPVSWEFSDSMGSVTSSLFPVELSGGNIAIKSDLRLWSPLSELQRYKVRNRKTIAYIFKGYNGNRFLKFTTVVNKVRFNTKGKRDANKIILDAKTKLSQWFDKDVVINKQLKGTTPKEFFKMAFNLSDNEVYYAEGVEESSFPQINNLHTKEYKTMSELLKAYCQNGIRFCFDRLERVKIFGDFKVDNINSNRVLDFDITDSMLTEDDQMIYNTINTQSYQRQTLYNFEDLDRKYVKFFKVKRGIVNSKDFMQVADNGDYEFKPLEITDEDFRSSVQLKDYVLFKRTVAPYEEYYGRVLAIDSDKVHVVPLIYDKDYKLFNYGKSKYLYNILVGQSCPMDMYYVREELPMIFKLTRKKGNDEVDSSLMLPLLPRVDGETKYKEEFNATFGSASNLKIGQYTGIVEEVDSIYGTWDNTKLLYNMEMTQFDNTIYPPIFALSNKVEERLINGVNPILNYTTFDNSNLMLEVDRPADNSCDAVLRIQNTKSVNKDIDLYVGKELSRLGNKILQVEDITPYKIGDVLVVNKPDNLTPQEETEFDEVLSTIRWTITYKESQRTEDGQDKHYIYVDSPFAKRQKAGEVYEFTRFPNTSIVFLQELYFRGNPVIEFAQDIVGMSKGTTLDGDTSREIYGEKKYELDSKQLNKENLRLLMGYILDNFQATSPQTTKFNVPLSVFNGLDLELLDTIRVNDPTYTQIKQDMQWVIVELSAKSVTNEIQLKLLNVNATNTKPYKIDIKDVIKYKPVEIPKYDHAGGEGNGKPNDDGTGGTNEDKTLGQFWLAEVDPQKFRARVEKFENNYIYFKDFNGTEAEQYKTKLFPVSEFAVNIKGEVIFVQSDSNYRAFIKKRRVYDTEEVLIAPEDDVKFLVTTTYVDIDGTFYGRKMMMGDGDNYLSVDPIKGVKIVGDFVVGENNRNPNNDLWQSLQNNRTFQQDNQPVNTPSYMIKEGDIWIDTDDQNHPYRYNGKVWLSTRDGSIVSTQNNVFIQPDEPQDKEGRPLIDGDTWYDSDDGNKPYVYKEGKWVNVTDMTLQEAIDNVEKQAKSNLAKLEDIANDNKLTQDEKKQIKLEIDNITTEYPIISTEAEKLGLSYTSYTQAYKSLTAYISPYLSVEGTSDINRIVFNDYFKDYYKYRQDLLNEIVTKVGQQAVEQSKNYSDRVIESLGKDLTIQIDGKINSYNQEIDPSSEWKSEDYQKHTGDLWYQPSSRLTRRWNGTSWDVLDVKDSVAQSIAQSKRRVFTTTPTVPYDSGDLWVTDLTSHGDMKVCKQTRHEGVYNSSDWVKATKYTDDTKANEAIRNAQQAQESANKANREIEEMASDNKLSPTEKQNTKKDLDIIQGEYNKLLDQAKLYGVDYTTYTQSYQALNLYLTPLLSDLTTTSTINGVEFRQKFKNYYDTRQDLLNKVTDAIKKATDKAQEDATTALGNAKIFWKPTEPQSGMKENDLWYDTDDGNHPYVYTNGRWTSARDKIYETEGGNKVYFQDTQPPSDGYGVKEGDMWFDTAHNNTQYVLMTQDNGQLKWVLASDALDKINTGRIVLNGNTQVNGDFIVRGKNVELTADTKINGTLEVFSNDKGIISYNGTTESNSTKRIIIRGGEIIFQERVL